MIAIRGVWLGSRVNELKIKNYELRITKKSVRLGEIN